MSQISDCLNKIVFMCIVQRSWTFLFCWYMYIIKSTTICTFCTSISVFVCGGKPTVFQYPPFFTLPSRHFGFLLPAFCTYNCKCHLFALRVNCIYFNIEILILFNSFWSYTNGHVLFTEKQQQLSSNAYLQNNYKSYLDSQAQCECDNQHLCSHGNNKHIDKTSVNVKLGLYIHWFFLTGSTGMWVNFFNLFS